MTAQIEELDPFAIPMGRVRMPVAASELEAFGFVDGLVLTVGRDTEHAYIRVSLGEDVIWGSEGSDSTRGVRFDHYAFLEFFADHWAALWLEGFPANVAIDEAVWSGRRPFDWPSLSKRVSSAQAWVEFQSRHCISKTILMPGERATQPEWWLVASGTRLHVAVPETGFFRAVSLGMGMSAIERCCNRIAEWLVAEPSEHGAALVARWSERRSRTGRVENARLYTGLHDETLLREVANDIAGESINDALHHRSPILAVARMRPARIEADDLRRMFAAITQAPKRDTPALDALSEAALAFCQTPDFDRLPPYVQGQVIASWLRRELRCRDDDILDPAEFLARYDVLVGQMELRSNALDAVAFWGPIHGPGVVTNSNGRFARTANGARATLAHEICHLLIDRQSHLPLADVVGGSVPEALEKRARAFAAELLLPQRVAYAAFAEIAIADLQIEALDELLDDLMQRYSVSRWIAGHQLRNSIRLYSDAQPRQLVPIIAYLDRCTSQPTQRRHMTRHLVRRS